MNFDPAALLLEDERARLAGSDGRSALTLYRSAAESAKLHKLPRHEALAHEGRARLLLALRREVEARAELQRDPSLRRVGAAVAAARVQRLEA